MEPLPSLRGLSSSSSSSSATSPYLLLLLIIPALSILAVYKYYYLQTPASTIQSEVKEDPENTTRSGEPASPMTSSNPLANPLATPTTTPMADTAGGHTLPSIVGSERDVVPEMTQDFGTVIAYNDHNAQISALTFSSEDYDSSQIEFMHCLRCNAKNARGGLDMECLKCGSLL